MDNNYSPQRLSNWKLSENFTLAELTYCAITRTYEVPNPDGIKHLEILCKKILQPIRSHFNAPVVIVAGYLAPHANERMGGAFNSRHLLCEAVDFNVIGVAPQKVYAWIRDNIDYDVLLREFENNDPKAKGWFHVTYDFTGNNRHLNLMLRATRKKVMLSPNFSLDELVYSATASAHRLFNVPNEAGIEKLRLLCQHILQPVRNHFGKPVQVNSGFRSPALNKLIKGSKTSQHMKCEAVDYEIYGVSNRELANWVGEHLSFDQLILEYHNDKQGKNDGWVHTSFVLSPSKRRQQKLTIDDSGTHLGISV